MCADENGLSNLDVHCCSDVFYFTDTMKITDSVVTHSDRRYFNGFNFWRFTENSHYFWRGGRHKMEEMQLGLPIQT